MVHDGLAAAVTVQARTFLRLQLEQFQDAHGLAGGGHHPQVAVRPGQHEPGGGDIEHVDAAVGQPGQQFDHVEVRHQRVRQLHQRPGEQRLFGYLTSDHVVSSLARLAPEVPWAWPSTELLARSATTKAGFVTDLSLQQGLARTATPMWPAFGSEDGTA